jgi:hypothetical protein
MGKLVTLLRKAPSLNAYARACRCAAWAAGAALALCVGACTTPSQSSPYPRGCYTGPLHLKLSTSTARPGDMVTVRSEGSWHSRNTETENYGLLGTTKGGRFISVYNLAAITPGTSSEHNFPVGSSNSIAGVGLPNRPFRIQIPPVSDGTYIVRFLYSAAPAGSNAGPKTYNLCTSLHIHS